MVENSHGRKDNRHTVEVWGSYRTPNGGKRDILFKDLSETGCRFFDKFSGLLPGAIISLRIEALGPFPAEVRWSRSGYVGAEFERPLYGPVFDHIRVRLNPQSGTALNNS